MMKRGMSTIITTILMVAFVLVAIGVVWAVISNLFSTQLEEISLGGSIINLKITSVKISDMGVDVGVKRGVGKGNLIGLAFIVSDGVDTEIFEEKNVSLEELEERVFTLDYSGLIKEISIAPILMSESGKESLRNIVDKETFSIESIIENPGPIIENPTNEQIIEDLSAISWWRFEDNADDEIGNNHGTLQGEVVFVEGKYGKSSDLSSSMGINVGLLGSPILTPEITMAFWIKVNNVSFPARQNPFNQAYGGWGTMTLETSGRISWFFGSNGGNGLPYGAHRSGPALITNGQWIHIVATRNPSDHTYKWYKNGEHFSGSTYDVSYPVISTRVLTLGDGYVNPINGLMDEVMIFNKSLTEAQVKALYELDLS